MTCIVYKDGVIASDSQIVSRTYALSGAFDKIGRRELLITPKGGPKHTRVFLYGATGETAYCYKFMQWVESEEFVKWGTNPAKGEGAMPVLEPAGKDESCTGLIFIPGKPQSICWRFEGNYPPFPLYGDYFAFGSGDAYALGALALGDAVHAVEQAIKHDVLTNGPVQSLRA